MRYEEVDGETCITPSFAMLGTDVDLLYTALLRDLLHKEALS